MRLHRFIIDTTLSDQITIEDATLLHQWTHVLRLKVGDRVLLCDGKGSEGEFEIERLDKKSAICHLAHDQKLTIEKPPQFQIILCPALIKHEHFDLIVEKATELGVTEIIPILTDRTIKTRFNRARLERIIREASEQSGRRWLPTLSDPEPLPSLLSQQEPPLLYQGEGAGGEVVRWFCDLDGLDPFNIRTQNIASAITILIGPEGGWTDAERELAKKHGCQIIKLSNHILRAETAAIVATFLVMGYNHRI